MIAALDALNLSKVCYILAPFMRGTNCFATELYMLVSEPPEVQDGKSESGMVVGAGYHRRQGVNYRLNTSPGRVLGNSCSHSVEP